MKLAFVLLFVATSVIAQTIRNDASCDISVAPAATLLLPYFEVDLYEERSRARDTMFTVTNVSPVTQIAHVTIWTDLAYPLYTFDLVLTGYDVQAISMWELLKTGAIAAPRGYFQPPVGRRSFPNPRHGTGVRADCLELPASIPPSMLATIQETLTTGRIPDCGQNAVGKTHTNAIGYATIDVVATCSSLDPTDAQYYDGHLLFDNVLTGDWVTIRPDPIVGNYAAGSPLVHIRAIPEGSSSGGPRPTPLPRTFYELYAPLDAPRSDRRQPLPVNFAARYIEGGTSGFVTDFLIWRQPVKARPKCKHSIDNFSNTADVVRFDERENVNVRIPCGGFLCPPPHNDLPVTSRTSTFYTPIYPPLTSGDRGGWMYINATSSATATQSWVVTTMFAEGRYSVAFDAVALGNGCSPWPAVSATIGPAR